MSAVVQHPSIDTVRRLVAASCGVSDQDILSERRPARVVYARHVGMWLSRQHTPYSLPRIGQCFGGRDHTTVLAACRKIDRLLASDEATGKLISDVTALLRQARLVPPASAEVTP